MRYFLVQYVRRPNGQIDEVSSVNRKLKTADYQRSNVILDFKSMQVVMAHADGKSLARDWNTIHDYYLQHYRNVFERLHRENGRQIIVDDESPAVASATEPPVQ